MSDNHTRLLTAGLAAILAATDEGIWSLPADTRASLLIAPDHAVPATGFAADADRPVPYRLTATGLAAVSNHPAGRAAAGSHR